MSALALVWAAALAAAPFPQPRLAPVSDALKSDSGVVLAWDAARSELRVTTGAGVVAFRVGEGVPVHAADGKPSGPAASLRPGQKVRVWYVLEAGAKAVEIAEQ